MSAGASFHLVPAIDHKHPLKLMSRCFRQDRDEFLNWPLWFCDDQCLTVSRWLLLRHAVHCAETPEQVTGVDSDHLAIREQFT
jgi:hypothetical protein